MPAPITTQHHLLRPTPQQTIHPVLRPEVFSSNKEADLVLDPVPLSRDHHPADRVPDRLIIPPGMAIDEFQAMGTSIQLLLPVQQAEEGSSIVRQLFAEWEQILSRFRPDSELAQLNQLAG